MLFKNWAEKELKSSQYSYPLRTICDSYNDHAGHYLLLQTLPAVQVIFYILNIRRNYRWNKQIFYLSSQLYTCQNQGQTLIDPFGQVDSWLLAKFVSCAHHYRQKRSFDFSIGPSMSDKRRFDIRNDQFRSGHCYWRFARFGYSKLKWSRNLTRRSNRNLHKDTHLDSHSYRDTVAGALL